VYTISNDIASTGLSLISDSVGPDFHFKTLKSADASVAIVDSGGGDISITVPSPPVYTIANDPAATGISLISDSVGPDFHFKTLKSSDASVTIAASGAGDVDLTVASGASITLSSAYEHLKTTLTGSNYGITCGFPITGVLHTTAITDRTTGYPSTATFSTFIGEQSGNDITTGTNNTLIGYYSGQKLTTGGYNVCIGANCGWRNTTGSSNVYIGESCASNGLNTGHTFQVFVGRNAGGMNGGTGSYSTCIGGAAGSSSTLGQYCLLLGSNSAVNSTVNDGAVVVGGGCAINGTIGEKSVHIGRSCAPNSTAGSLNFGNAMQAVTPAASTTGAMETAFIPITWNGVNYRIPALSSSATYYTHGDMPVGELAYYDATGTSFAQNTDIALGTLTTTSNLMPSAYFDQPVAGRLRYLRTRTQVAHVAISISATVGGNNQEYTFTVLKNGVKVTNSDYSVTFPNAGKPTTFAYHIVVSFATNDYITVQYAYKSATGDITFQNFNVVIMGSCPSM
jgi:hypothetical protein